MKRKLTPILAALAVTLSALASTAMAVETFTYDARGNLTHIKGIPVEPIQTPEEARIATEKRIAEIKAEEAKQATQAAELATRDRLPATAPQEIFFTGKPYLEETGQYLFLFRHYDPELARWTTTDPSGFPDGANNVTYAPRPLFEMDPFGLKTVTVTGIPTTGATGASLSISVVTPARQVGSSIRAEMVVEWGVTSNITGWVVQRVQWDWDIRDDATGSQVGYNAPSDPVRDYWEAWRVENGVFSTYGSRDFYDTGGPQLSSTTGFISITGKVDFYRDDVVSSNSPASWGCVSTAGILPATTTQPSWWTGSGFNHNLTLTWVE